MFKALGDVLKAYAKNLTRSMAFLISFALITGIIGYTWTFRLGIIQASIAFWVWFVACLICMIIGYSMLTTDQKIEKSKGVDS